MRKRILIAALLSSAALGGYAQNDADVQRYTANYFGGTARFQSMGGAFGALGGDMSSIHLNPAAVGVYRFGTISFTPALEFNSIDAETDFTSIEDSKTKMVVNNVGFVLANEIRHPQWRSINFSVSYNRINTFNDITRLEGRHAANDGLAGDFLFEAQGRRLGELSDFGAGLAWDAFVIDNANYTNIGTPNEEAIDDGEYVLVFDPEQEIRTVQTAERDGRLSETALTLGANYDDRLYIGFGLGFQDVTYQYEITTVEETVAEPNTDLVRYTFNEILESDGLGVNAKLGFIYRTKVLRFGASVRTPTVFSMTDNFTADIRSTLQNPDDQISSESGVGFFEYRIRTPWHFMGSVAAVIGKKAILSGQYERIDFGGGELRNSGGADTDFSFINQTIAQGYSASDIFRFGGEYRLSNNFTARAGYAWFANPITSNEQFTDENLNRQHFNFGLGLRQATWYLDLAYSRAVFNEIYPYTDLNLATLGTRQDSFMLTLGFRM